ncbi:dihydrofolate reductase family protein [Actinacidiphila bryophytorum]|uniref:Bacterial bifunctional deaminase-reductase C-terminal domain-containing protein n=1 Tax=Actinacidiphila bryophytorum TaxID=1436133 RepID=A0A9W4H301_9ACTN|nr:dihydrofolate reductase family protein [Actinacidiphila bryophytorum]MBM9437055.1 dihydrofolate reductase family protein [Actinacidiphila bryophytorum]CAG7646432.1 hypothetical protein SBRY_40410 [Actinacidiphila bryophytorum]
MVRCLVAAAASPRPAHDPARGTARPFPTLAGVRPAAPRWTEATKLAGEPAAEITRLKASVDGEILVYASYRLVRLLIDHDLVDELRLVVFPVILGSGKRLFGDTVGAKGLRLIEAQQLGENLTFVRYATTA